MVFVFKKSILINVCFDTLLQIKSIVIVTVPLTVNRQNYLPPSTFAHPKLQGDGIEGHPEGICR